MSLTSCASPAFDSVDTHAIEDIDSRLLPERVQPLLSSIDFTHTEAISDVSVVVVRADGVIEAVARYQKVTQVTKVSQVPVRER